MMIRRPVAVASAALSVLVFSACSGGGESVPEDAPTSPPASVGEVGGSPAYGGGGVSQRVAPWGMLAGGTMLLRVWTRGRLCRLIGRAMWGVELSPDFFGAEHTPFVFYGVTVP